MAIPRVFLSSTCYDLGPIRDSLAGFVEDFGFDPCLSDRGDVFYHPDLHTHDSCLAEIANCHLFVLVIGGRFGGSYVSDLEKSIVNAEFAAAKELRLPVFSFVKREVLEDHRVYQKNKASSIIGQIEFPAIEKQSLAGRIFEFIDEVRLAHTNNGFFPFEHSRDIERVLRRQWAGMMFDFLQRRRLAEQYENQNKLLSSLTATTGQLEDLIKKLYRQADQVHADAVIENVEWKSKADQFFRDLFREFGVDGFYRTSLEQLLALPFLDTWFEWLASTNDFEIWRNIEEKNTGRLQDVIGRHDTNTVLCVRGPHLRPSELKKVAEFEDLFSAFRQLPTDTKRGLLTPYVLNGSAST